ncbi:subtilase-type protease inhibitor [Nocardia sp. NPDC004722]
MSIGLRMLGVGVGVATTLVVLPAAHADDLPASALTLTVAQGESLETASSQRSVVLICAPTVLGTHPAAAPACDELNTAGGDFEKLHGRPMRFCPMIYDPVTVAADGIWQGNPVSYRHTYPSMCAAENRSTSVFEF